MSLMADTLFGLVPVASSGQQWVARDLQVVNWGGYDGRHRIRLASTATLVSGASGSGKSTLLDAYVALMMPHTTPFNGASNGAVVGRPRGRDQRNVLSYARGKIDESRTEAGTRERVLRGADGDTWSAVAMTWADQSGRRFTALRGWYVPAGAQRVEDLVAVRATTDADLDLADLAPSAARRFRRTDLTALGLVCYDTDRELTARLHTTLGIGAAGGGAKAVGLLARIQAGQQITTVDALYKAMVLEEPETLAVADAAVEQFDNLTEVRDRMLAAQRQVRALRPIRAHRAAVDAARERTAVVDAVGGPDDPASPFCVWRDERRLTLLRDAEAEHAATARRLTEHAESARAVVVGTEHEHDALRDAVRAQGGDRLEAVERELARAQETAARVRAERARLDRWLAELDASVTSRADLDRQRAASRGFVAAADASRRTARDERLAAYEAVTRARAEADRLEREHTSLGRRRGNVPDELHRARVALAQAAGLDVDELPFVAELVEVRTEHEHWRDAISLALGGFALTLLVDADRVGAFRAAIDAVPSAVRLRFEGATVGVVHHGSVDASLLPGRLDLRDGPFTGWLAERLDDRFAYVCVDDARDLGTHGLALTRTGQTSEGRRGAHGGHGRASVLGFSNTRRLADLASQLDAAREELRLASERSEGVDLRAAAAEEQRAVHAQVAEAEWERVDVVGAERAVADWSAQRDALHAGSDTLRDLEARLREVAARLDTQRQDAARAAVRRDDAHAAWERATDAVDACQTALDRAADKGVEVTAAQRDYLDAGSGVPLSLDGFDGAVRALAAQTVHERALAAAEERAGLDALAAIFTHFTDTWPNPDLGTDPDASYADFDRLLATVESEGLHELEGRWSRSLAQLSGNDLTILHAAIGRSVREITERIEPVNAILADLPFADADHRLRIDARPVESAVVARFRKALRELATDPTSKRTEAEQEARFARMARLIDRIRRTSPDFADLVDVRRHVRVSAEKVDLAGRHVALYDHIGEKSGGESQELVAFIVGAALRYQLGDAAAERPRYAPVFLDEALIKADARFAGRAVGAWRGLGFQLVIGAPLDKVGALEPFVDAAYEVVKTPDGRSRPLAVVGLDD
ncbi:ATP-binding protein [Luteimicrobium subarcticum]|uniref:Uncharacterized protein YPO0396 n=1 Tax=Luteimicrobium subarcticum TaxID=620910 RepID=A0A2M8WQY4_9MICO|nr:SbcC/MukB-like Walker B domain-containing protein [Luteimicrobium subarcticum]PJI93338.1 uncharacterized protein YPO0396 [Luteimicrobium subarcticum]